MALEYSLTTWNDLTAYDRDVIYVKLTLQGTQGSAMRNLINYGGTGWFDQPLSVARSGGEVIGWSLWTNDDEIWVFVKPSYRNKGVGRSLVKLLSKKINSGSATICNHDGLSRAFWSSMGASDTDKFYGVYDIKGE
jgi:GNAT superfamily N-acetyltransferase